VIKTNSLRFMRLFKYDENNPEKMATQCVRVYHKTDGTIYLDQTRTVSVC